MIITNIRLLFAPKKVSEFKDLRKRIEKFNFNTPIDTDKNLWDSEFKLTFYKKKIKKSYRTNTNLKEETIEKIKILTENTGFTKNYILNIILYKSLYK